MPSKPTGQPDPPFAPKRALGDCPVCKPWAQPKKARSQKWAHGNSDERRGARFIWPATPRSSSRHSSVIFRASRTLAFSPTSPPDVMICGRAAQAAGERSPRTKQRRPRRFSAPFSPQNIPDCLDLQPTTFATGFDETGSNEIAFGAKFTMAHAQSMVLEVSDSCADIRDLWLLCSRFLGCANCRRMTILERRKILAVISNVYSFEASVFHSRAFMRPRRLGPSMPSRLLWRAAAAFFQAHPVRKSG